jgi:hypothetical protein
MTPLLTKLAGTSFGNCQENIRNYANPAKLGIDEYDLVREPENQSDTNAIRVGFGPFEFGYIPSPLAQTLAPLMDSGRNLVVKHVSLNQHPHYEKIGLTVRIIEKLTN